MKTDMDMDMDKDKDKAQGKLVGIGIQLEQQQQPPPLPIMPIRSLEPFPESLSLDALKNCVVGIDVQHYVTTSLLSANVDPTFEALGGFPISLESRVVSDAAAFKALGIRPVYVFPGMKPISQFSYTEQPDLLPYEKHLQHLWETKKSNPNADISFRCSDNPYLLRSIMDQLLVILQDHDLEYLVSPFSQLHQLFYMWKTGVVNCIYSSNDALLLQGLDNFILSIDFKAKTFHFLDSRKLLADLNLSFKQFRDVSMCVGNLLQPFQLITGPNSDFFSLCQNTQNGSFSAYAALSSSSDDSKKLDRFIKGCSTLDYCPVLKVNGRVEPFTIEVNDSLIFQHSGIPGNNASSDTTPSIKDLSDKKLPSKLHEVFGPRLPDEFFFYQSIGLNLFGLAESFLDLNFVERLPLDMTTDPIYEKIIVGNISMKYKETMFNLFAGSLHRYLQTRRLVLKTYFNGVVLHEIDYRIIPPISTKVRSLVVRHTTAKSFDLASVLSNLSDTFLEESTFSGPINISTNHELIATSVLRTLTLYQFIDENPFKLSKWGHALSKYLSKSNANFETTLLLFLFFQRFQDLDLEQLAKSSDIQFEKNEKYNLSSLLLISNFSTLFKVQHTKPSNYTGLVSRSLLHFHSSMNKLHTEIKDFITVNVLVLLFGNKNDIDKFIRDNSQWCSLATEIPFKSSMSNTLAGLLVAETIKTFLSVTDTSIFKSNLEEKLSSFKGVVENPVQEAAKALKFVLSVCDIIDVLAEEGLTKQSVAEKFTGVRSTLSDIIALF